MQNEERINGLEAQVRTLKRIVFLVCCLLVAGVVINATSLQTVPDVLKAKSIEVIDNNGKTVVYLGSLIEGTEQIASPFGEGSGLTRNKYLGYISTRNSEGKDLVEMTASIKGEGWVQTSNGKGQDLVRLGTTVKGAGMVVTENGKGQTLVELGATVGGAGMVQTSNSKGQLLATMAATTGGQGTVETYNGKDQALVRLGVYSGTHGGYVETFTQTGVSTSEIP